MIGRYQDAYHDEDGRTSNPGASHTAHELEADGHVDGDVSLDGEGEDQTRRVVAEHVHAVLQELTQERTPVEDGRTAVVEVQTADGRESVREEDTE